MGEEISSELLQEMICFRMAHRNLSLPPSPSLIFLSFLPPHHTLTPPHLNGKCNNTTPALGVSRIGFATSFWKSLIPLCGIPVPMVCDIFIGNKKYRSVMLKTQASRRTSFQKNP